MIRFRQKKHAYISEIKCLYKNGTKIIESTRKHHPEAVKVLDSLDRETKDEPCDRINAEEQILQNSISQDLNVKSAGEALTANDVLSAQKNLSL